MMKSSGPMLPGESRPEGRGARTGSRIQVRRAIGILTSVVLVCASVVVLETRAADEPDRPAATQPGARTASPAAATPGATRSPSVPNPKAPSAKSPAPGAPQVPEESATIRDDPTIAPDPKQSADNNVSFPSDI